MGSMYRENQSTYHRPDHLVSCEASGRWHLCHGHWFYITGRSSNYPSF